MVALTAQLSYDMPVVSNSGGDAAKGYRALSQAGEILHCKFSRSTPSGRVANMSRFALSLLVACWLCGFATPAAAQEAPPPAAPPPEIIVDTCLPGPYIVHFEWGRADVDAHSMRVLDNLIDNGEGCYPASLSITGHTDSTEPARLGGKRADAIRRYLIEHGVKAAPVRTTARGSDDPRKIVPKGVRERQNRRVEISFGAPG